MNRHKVAVLLILTTLLLTSCNALAQPSATAPTLLPTQPSAATSTPQPSRTPIPTQTSAPRRTTTLSLTPSATPTPKVQPVSWLVPARQFLDWPVDEWGGYSLTWHPYNLEIEYRNNQVETRVRYDLSQDFLVPAQVPANDNTNEEVIYSSQKTYMVVCTDPTEDERGFKKYHTLQLVRVEDDMLISQASNITTWCGHFIRWAPSENILSFVNQDPTTDKNGHHRLDIYAWKTNGTKPYRIGLGIGYDDPGSWSPDLTRLAVEFQDLSINDPEDETYMILYSDGRPPKKTKARLGVRAMPGVSWLTNNIVYEFEHLWRRFHIY